MTKEKDDDLARTRLTSVTPSVSPTHPPTETSEGQQERVVYAVFALHDDIGDPHGADELYSLWASRELAQAEADRLAATGSDFTVSEIEVKGEA